MRTGIPFIVLSSGHERLKAIIRGPKNAQNHVRSARIILLTASGVGTSAIMATTGKSKTTT